MKKRILVFIIIFVCITFIPIFIFPRNTSVEDAQYDLAVELFKTQRYRDAIKEFERLLYTMKTQKYRDACYYYIGNSFYYLKNYKSAKRQFETIVNRYKTSGYSSQSLYLMGRCELLLGKYTESIRLFDSYVRRYPSLDYADNSLYWKAEALLSLGKREEAKNIFKEQLKRYPYGNKADAARFKLRLMELEEQMAMKEEIKKGQPLEMKEEGDELAPYIEEIKQMKKKEEEYKGEIEKLNNQVDYLRTEIDNLKELGAGTADEQQINIDELFKWRIVLEVKEQALKFKEDEINEVYEKVMSIKDKIEGKENE